MENLTNFITKTFIFKVKNLNECIINEDVINEYKNHYNKLSNFINEHLTSLTIGEIAQTVYKGEDSPLYVTLGMSEEWKDKPLYYIFTKKYHTQSADNLLYEYIKIKNIDNYTSNILNLSETYYKRNGYFKLVMSNYRTKIREMKLSIKKQKIEENSNVEMLEEQTIYEMVKYKLNTIKEWENYIEYLTDKEDANLDYIQRCKILKDYFIKNEELLKEKMTTLSIEQLKQFGGCAMKGNGSMNILIQNYTIEEKEDSLGFVLNLPLNKKIHKIELWGNRQIKCGTKNEYKLLIDIINTKGQSINFKIKNGKLYVSFACDYSFNKTTSEYKQTVGIDVNVKHALIVTSENENNIKGYLNLYKHVLKNEKFVSLLSSEELNVFKSLSKNVVFCPIEFNFLFSRIFNDSYKEKELVFTDILYTLQKELKKAGKVEEHNYVSCVNKIRAKYVSYFKLKDVYSQKQKEYDIQMGFCDESTESKETMDQRRMEFPFRNTEIAVEILNKMNNILQDIEGCRKNIVSYAYKIFEQNGYDTIVLENLDNSNFDKTQVLPTTVSLLKYHKIQGKTIEEAKENKNIGNLIDGENYNFILDENNRINDAVFSEKGLYKVKKALFINQAIKTLHFSSIKDDFILLSNNGQASVVLVPAEYTSQMDSQKHVIYYKKNEKGKLVKASKKSVRQKQETYINGLNADVNAANNIKYIVENEQWRNIFCVKPKNYDKNYGYRLPQLESTKKGQHNILLELKKLGACEELNTAL